MNDRETITNYVQQTAQLLDLPGVAAYLPGVVANFGAIAEAAALVNEFPLPQEIEAAPQFEP
ncbi:MAG: DUF4089 domain-containing protein [Chloroflexaceae bacterium]|nr:DUF4089 domain-containing protein [Chloroflexaceae bacterium]